jgi:sulfur-carrier protein
VRDALDTAVERYGPEFARVLATCRVWVNGDSASLDDEVGVDDEIAVLPPVSGGT